MFSKVKSNRNLSHRFDLSVTSAPPPSHSLRSLVVIISASLYRYQPFEHISPLLLCIFGHACGWNVMKLYSDVPVPCRNFNNSGYHQAFHLAVIASESFQAISLCHCGSLSVESVICKNGPTAHEYFLKRLSKYKLWFMWGVTNWKKNPVSSNCNSHPPLFITCLLVL